MGSGMLLVMDELQQRLHSLEEKQTSTEARLQDLTLQFQEVKTCAKARQESAQDHGRLRRCGCRRGRRRGRGRRRAEGERRVAVAAVVRAVQRAREPHALLGRRHAREQRGARGRLRVAERLRQRPRLGEIGR